MFEIARIERAGIDNNREITRRLAACEWFRNQGIFEIMQYLRYAQTNNLVTIDGEYMVFYHNCD